MKKNILSNENLGVICTFFGLALLAIAQFQPGDILTRLLPGIISLLAGGMFRGIVTIQNILDLKNKKD